MKQLPVGVEDFKKLIDKNAYYVDKSQFIVDCMKEECALYTRPRRFGKTLNMSMLYYFFSSKEKDNAYLFDGLKVTSYPEVMKHQNQYPTIFISLKSMKSMSFSNQIKLFANIIKKVVLKNKELLDSKNIDESDKQILNDLRFLRADSVQLMESLEMISRCLMEHYHQKVIILIDEYDVPLQSAYQNGYYDEMVDFLREVFSSALKSNNNLEKGILTGCLRISKESIFTGLNNFKVYSMLNVGNEENFGFTESEVKQILEDYHLSDCFDEVKEWYDGYLFGDKEIYNPWSTILYISDKVEKSDSPAISYWANTSGNDLVYSYIQNAPLELREEFEQLMQGKSVIKTIKQDLTYREMDDINNVYSFLLLTGYLKVKSVIKGKVANNIEVPLIQYELIIPNMEIYQIYYTHFNEYFNHYQDSHRQDLFDALANGEEEKANDILNSILERSISYFDNQENFYHGFLVGLFIGEYNVESNRESGNGRFDLCVMSKSPRNPAVIIECKHSRDGDDLVDDSEAGAKQIIEKKYLEDKKLRKYSPVVGYGISFYKKECYVVRCQEKDD